MDAIEYTQLEKLYKKHILDRVKDYCDDAVRQMSIEGWENDYMKVCEVIKIRRMIRKMLASQSEGITKND